MSPMRAEQIVNFGAGPAKLPSCVVHQTQKDLENWNEMGVGIMEISHRSSQFEKLMNDTRERLCRLVGIPDDYAVLFMQGGGTLQFAAIIYNMIFKETSNVSYLVSGCWSKKAVEEGEKILDMSRCKVNSHFIISEDGSLKNEIDWNIPTDTLYVYYCDNETIDGIEMPTSSFIREKLDKLGINAPIVCDMSSNFLSRPIDVTQFGLIFATAQKNFGPAGCTVVIVKRSLLPTPQQRAFSVPTMMDYLIFDKYDSLYNTPPVFAISVCNLTFRWIEEQFGDLGKLANANAQKAQRVYECIDQSSGFYKCPVSINLRSRMNVVARIIETDGRANAKLEKMFIEEAEKMGLLQLKGHRSVGGIRISLYNSITLEETERVVDHMISFYRNIQK